MSTTGRHTVTVERQGLTFSMDPFSHKGVLPHDLVHFLAEESFRVLHGIWGSIAEGAIYESMILLTGRLRHDARARSAAVIKANLADIGLGELLPGPVMRAIDRKLDLASAYKDLAHTWGTLRTDAMPYEPRDLDAAIVSFKRAIEEWRSTPVGEALAVEWLPVKTGPRQSQSTQRRSVFGS